MTDWTPREFEIALTFLPEGSFEMESYQDGSECEPLWQ
jgi:hypothetical protein